MRLITNLVPGNSLQYLIDGDQECLPSAGHWATLHIQLLEMLVGSERDRFCYFYFYELPRACHGGRTLIGDIIPARLGCRLALQLHLALFA